MQPLGRFHDFSQEAFLAVTNMQLIQTGFDMDIAGAFLDGAMDQHIEQPDRGHAVNFFVGIFFVLGLAAFNLQLIAPRQVLQEPFQPVIRMVDACDSVGDLGASGYHRLDGDAGRELQVQQTCKSVGFTMATTRTGFLLRIGPLTAEAPSRLTGMQVNFRAVASGILDTASGSMLVAATLTKGIRAWVAMAAANCSSGMPLSRNTTSQSGRPVRSAISIALTTWSDEKNACSNQKRSQLVVNALGDRWLDRTFTLTDANQRSCHIKLLARELRF